MTRKKNIRLSKKTYSNKNMSIAKTCTFCHKSSHLIGECEILKNVKCSDCGGNHTRKHCTLTWCSFCKKMSDHTVIDCDVLLNVICPICQGNHTRKLCTKTWCSFCKTMADHDVSNCPLLAETTCTVCKKVGHTKAKCKVFIATLKCKECGKNGHSEKTCPAMAYVRCYMCKEHGHYGNKCPQRI
jgi:hypothetical protein